MPSLWSVGPKFQVYPERPESRARCGRSVPRPAAVCGQRCPHTAAAGTPRGVSVKHAVARGRATNLSLSRGGCRSTGLPAPSWSQARRILSPPPGAFFSVVSFLEVVPDGTVLVASLAEEEAPAA